MEQIDILLKDIHKQKDEIIIKRQEFLKNYNRAKLLATEDEDYLAEMGEYAEEKIKKFDVCLQEIEDLEFKTEESKIQAEENLTPIDISPLKECLLQIAKRHIFMKYFFWE